MAITLAHAEKMLERWLDAEERAAESGQSISMREGDGVQHYSLDEIARRVRYWERKIAELSGTGQLSFSRGVNADLER